MLGLSLEHVELIMDDAVPGTPGAMFGLLWAKYRCSDQGIAASSNTSMEW